MFSRRRQDLALSDHLDGDPVLGSPASVARLIASESVRATVTMRSAEIQRVVTANRQRRAVNHFGLALETAMRRA